MLRVFALAAVVALFILSPALAQQSLVDLSTQQFAAGRKIELDLGTARVNWTNARWAVVQFDQPRDLRPFGSVKVTVTTDKPRSDAGVYLAVKEADGSWYYVGWAANLTQATNTGIAHFADFAPTDYMSPPGGGHFDENGRLDLDQIAAVAVGCVNPLGVGKVSFTVTGLELQPIERYEPAPVPVKVSGRPLDVNGTTTIPAGLFGGFNLKNRDDGKPRVTHYRLAQDRRINPGGPTFGDAVTHMMINTIGDRTGPSMRLTDANWEQNCAANGTKYGEAAKASGKLLYVEWWNEPYLNWANINRKNFDPRFYDESKAAEGGPVHLKIDGSEMPYLKWTQKYPVPAWNWCENLQQWRRGKDDKGRWTMPYAMPYSGWNPPKWRAAAAKLNPPDDVRDGQTYVADGKTWTAFTPWHVYDTTQFTYWSGKGMLKAYIDPMLAFGTAAKKAGGDRIVFIAGWGNRPSEDHWAGFTQLYQATIDAGIDIIDGVCDHDYGGDPLKMPASYQFITAYGVTKHNKWLYGFNTETAAGSDPQAYPDAGGVGSKQAQADRIKLTWTSRKLLHALCTVPDKARSFSWFGVGGNWFSDTGEGVALELMKNLRGRLMHVETGDPQVYAVAAIDGADPLNPRPADMPQRQELVVAVLNDHLEERQADLSIAAPAGTKFSQVIISQPNVSDPAAVPSISQETEPFNGEIYTLRQTLPSRQPVVLTFPLTGTLADTPPVRRAESFSPALLSHVTPDKPLSTSIAVDQQQLAGAGRAWLTIVVERLGRGEGTVTVNGRDYPLPAAVTPENTPWVRHVPVDVADLKATNELLFKVTSPAEAGYLLACASLVLETK